ncbi:hypothetical protein A3J89_00295 [Candidatus Curtissbacteria bacterium RIFOXYB12_FULL_40_6]|nr:MAG: hypothetical protein A3J89_00295 [Candidatus Curtissbacteria bacterium RIFOXYB12_FULL_40_6]
MHIPNKKDFLILVFLLLFSTIQFILILRHKSPYLSDSYFYKHIFYQFQGNSFQESRELVLNQVDFANSGQISRNIFQNKAVYSQVYDFFKKRPLYPFLAYLFNKILHNEYQAFLLPVFISYLGVVLLAFYFFSQGLNRFFAAFTASLFISFYPFLDWSTYFLTDTMGAAFWLLQLFFIYKFAKDMNPKWLYLFSFFLVISFLNREQSILMLPLLVLASLFVRVFKIGNFKKKFFRATVVSFLLTILYILVSYATNQKNVLDTLIYTMNSYGLYSNSYSNLQVINYIAQAVIDSHLVFVRELVSRHWWFVLCLFALFKVVKLLIRLKPSILDILMICSAVASYLAIFIYPVLSYRFFFPVVITVVYFASGFIHDFFKVGKVTE